MKNYARAILSTKLPIFIKYIKLDKSIKRVFQILYVPQYQTLKIHEKKLILKKN